MKFYYKGELIRSSNTHIYTHAVVAPSRPEATNRWLCYGCRSSRTGANNLLNEMKKRYKNSPERIAAMRVVELEQK